MKAFCGAIAVGMAMIMIQPFGEVRWWHVAGIAILVGTLVIGLIAQFYKDFHSA